MTLVLNTNGVEFLTARQLAVYSRRVMAKENTDRTTIDLFADDKRPGRPKTNPLSRKDQLKVNKRNQLKRDRNKGLKRIELKVESELLNQLNQLAKDHSLSRSEFITQLIRDSIKKYE